MTNLNMTKTARRFLILFFQACYLSFAIQPHVAFFYFNILFFSSLLYVPHAVALRIVVSAGYEEKLRIKDHVY